MAFFGITALGPQNPFETHLINAIGLKMFTQQEFKSAFQRIDKDHSGTIEYNELFDLLFQTYGLEPLEEEVELFMEQLDANRDGRITWEEFSSALTRIKENLDGKAKRASQITSFEQWNFRRTKHIRSEVNPGEKYIKPLTWGQNYGFHDTQKARQQPEITRNTFYRTRCPETKFADSMILKGHFLG